MGEYISGKHVALYADIDGHYIIDYTENMHLCTQNGIYNAAERVYLQSLTIDRRSAHQAELLLHVIFVKFMVLHVRMNKCGFCKIKIFNLQCTILLAFLFPDTKHYKISLAFPLFFFL